MVSVLINLCIAYRVDSDAVDVHNIISKTAGNPSVISADFRGQTAHAENVVTTGSQSASHSVKNPFHGFSFAIKSAEQSIVNAYSSNHYYLQNLFIRFSHTDLIFPFHYFW
jgi:hypothetical protein